MSLSPYLYAGLGLRSLAAQQLLVLHLESRAGLRRERWESQEEIEAWHAINLQFQAAFRDMYRPADVADNLKLHDLSHVSLDVDMVGSILNADELQGEATNRWGVAQAQHSNGVNNEETFLHRVWRLSSHQLLLTPVQHQVESVLANEGPPVTHYLGLLGLDEVAPVTAPQLRGKAKKPLTPAIKVNLRSTPMCFLTRPCLNRASSNSFSLRPGNSSVGTLCDFPHSTICCTPWSAIEGMRAMTTFSSEPSTPLRGSSPGCSSTPSSALLWPASSARPASFAPSAMPTLFFGSIQALLVLI